MKGYLRLEGDHLVFFPPVSQEEEEGSALPITVIDGSVKPCLSFGTIIGGLIVVVREGVDGVSSLGGRKASSGRRGKTAGGTPVSSDTKRTVSVFSFDPNTISIHFHTHISVDGWTSLTVREDSPFVILSDYDTAHSEVLEWLPPSKTLRRVWEGRGSCPRHYHNGGSRILMLLYTARTLALYDGKTMKEVDECNARSRDLDIVDVISVGRADGFSIDRASEAVHSCALVCPVVKEEETETTLIGSEQTESKTVGEGIEEVEEVTTPEEAAEDSHKDEHDEHEVEEAEGEGKGEGTQREDADECADITEENEQPATETVNNENETETPREINDGTKMDVCNAQPQEDDTSSSSSSNTVNSSSDSSDNFYYGCNYAIVIYESGSCSIFSVGSNTVSRIMDLGKVLGTSKVAPNRALVVDETGAIILYRYTEGLFGCGVNASEGSGSDSDECDTDGVVCFLNPMTVGSKNSFEKSIEPINMFRKMIRQYEATRCGLAGDNSSRGFGCDVDVVAAAPIAERKGRADSRRGAPRGKRSSEGGDRRLSRREQERERRSDRKRSEPRSELREERSSRRGGERGNATTVSRGGNTTNNNNTNSNRTTASSRGDDGRRNDVTTSSRQQRTTVATDRSDRRDEEDCGDNGISLGALAAVAVASVVITIAIVARISGQSK